MIQLKFVILCRIFMTYFLILDIFYKKIIHANMKCSIARYFSFCLFLLVKKRFSHLSWLTQVLCLSLYDCPSIGLISTMCVFQLFILVMGLRPGLAQGGQKQIFYGGAIVNSEKWIIKNSQNLLNKSPKHGGASAPPAPPAPPPCFFYFSIPH